MSEGGGIVPVAEAGVVVLVEEGGGVGYLCRRKRGAVPAAEVRKGVVPLGKVGRCGTCGRSEEGCGTSGKRGEVWYLWQK
jgi:hypothetical protein